MATSIFKEYFKGYEILGELGRGNARVLKARHLQTGRLVAIKHFAFNADADTLRRFQRESEIMKSIAHDSIVKIIEVHLDAELPYLVMELIEGGDLRSMLKASGTLDIPTVIALARQMFTALDIIHTKSIVHRDVKPENIMYRRLPNGELQFLLTDFGIAKLREQADAVTVTGASMMTYDYASPEQFNQPRTVGAATDYYSLGIVLYECITGAVPFEYRQEDLLMHIHRVISSPLPVPFLPGGGAVSRPMLLLLEGLTRKRPEERLCDAVRAAQLLDIAETGNHFPAAPEPVIDAKKTLAYNAQPQTSPHRKRAYVFFASFLLLAAIVLVFSGYYFLRHKNRQHEEVSLPSAIASLPATAGTKHVLPSEANHVVHARNTPVVLTGANATTSDNDPGVSLVNGMYYDDFDQQDSLWDTGKDDNSEFILLDGKYIMKGLRDSLSYSSSIKLNLDTSKDFTITANATHDGEGSGDPFGIIFCGDESKDAFLVFYITSNGYYAVGTSVKDEWNELLGWTASANLRQNAEMNVFSIERRGPFLRLLVNDKLERVLPFPGSYGTHFGLRIDGSQTVAFDQFIVKGTQPANKL
ncbi:MAG: serine/threonine-protein kinase [Chitinophagaceae bacterium]